MFGGMLIDSISRAHGVYADTMEWAHQCLLGCGWIASVGFVVCMPRPWSGLINVW